MPFQHSRLAFLVTLLLLTVLGCARRSDAEHQPADAGGEYETLELRYQGANGAVLYPELAAELGFLAPLKLRWVGNTISGPQDIQTVVTNDVEFGAAFNGSIIKLILAGAPIQAVLGVYSVDRDTWSGFYVLDGSSITSARDFIGKKGGYEHPGGAQRVHAAGILVPSRAEQSRGRRRDAGGASARQ
jgi:ABC-type nitrate/sulfonate/bicarbonate transport system substrate-binding protein